jgi:hypothetical protein
LEELHLDGTMVAELGFLAKMPLRWLTLAGCRSVSNFQVLADVESLTTICFP